MFKKYIEYLRYNPEGYWFKRKLYGWGWTPAKWQGWVVMAVFFGFVIFQATMFDTTAQTTNDLTLFLTEVILTVVLLIYICYKTGEKPKWMWGLRNKTIVR
ncbi:MAG: hypothetical protein A3C50_03055 [Candidatus Staskawiczbacteria bacterium RIFCSPHIGHO2_02_FULL_43_16]|uniref:Uncharacterized protein n=1 Tax=Candidatus Staskawiczbacteria bacterium RIFCSPHIGHO2_01_FULL_41_41 TaxID=1802203 RepID=A0A1G2HU29_9BACT|nr:MAG: hypothetical protein A2822_02925 [Candidatus Staskawiczbacteria bacterium RIFCSPHIGHO2_01_FULL_41_41]OGZ68681.1 MAG: hypothetical protein A3C50_03055 [Candidatus Staskawiczbacteria bacterium RIFCSPHIGHO2_02_FULL_43_16]OGZ75144.1 MAG: hypothetical protein A3A12_00985 [Candidatus Staskawiczbacteria bacterium RIFCSPLOWO2_01_FULL_43_17b]